ncbi:MAG: cation:proton antiporter [Lentimicrobiaceae bacterium]|nr:cation:proton antiporter [Lentimicrobiaceae bacterium]
MLHLPVLIVDLALILGAAAIVTLLFRKLKQPVVLGYIIAGLLVGPNFKLFPTIVEIESIRTWADIGVIFLLFGLGLEFSFKKLIKVGAVAVITALTEVTLTMFLGYNVGKMLGWNAMDSLFLGGILAIASTTIIIRTFDELGVKNQKFTGIVTGVLVIEDLVAVLLMVLLSTVAVSKTFAGGEMVMSVLKLAFFLVLWFVSGIFFLPTLFIKIRSFMNEETLLIISLALCFLMVVLATYAGFSPALGAFIMGSILAETTKAEKIEHLTKSVKNLFGAIFFVSVGMLLDPQMLVQHAIPIVAATLVLFLGKPLFVTMGVLAAGQPLKIAVQSGMSLSQIGELSFIIATLGLTLNVTSNFLYPVAVAVSVLTTFTTPYMIRFSEPVYKRIESILPPKWKNLLVTYSVGAQNMAEISEWKKMLRFYFINVVVFSVVIITIILLSTQYLAPLFASYGWSQIITVTVTLAVLSPFLWALAFRRTQRQAYANVWLKTYHRGPLLVLLTSRVALAVFYIGFLFDRLFSPWIALIGIIVSCIILLLFSKKIKTFYGKIEMRFLTNLNEREVEKKEILAPWDTHIATFELNALSPYIGKLLLESKIREEFGVNIAVIERGDFVINVPGRDEYLFPNDKLSVIGTDEQLEKFKKHLESSMNESQIVNTKQKVSLHHFTVGKHSPLAGKNIRESRIRELTKGLVVGVERNGIRLLNPESDLVFETGDKVWIVGNEKRIQVLTKELYLSDS